VTPVTAKPLSRGAIDALAQLFVNGPTWDGNLITKSGRDQLVEAGLAAKVGGGWNFLTIEGVLVASEWRTGGTGSSDLDRRWSAKVSNR
jgi:hypothetical protein